MYSVSYLPTTYSYAFLYSYRILQMYISYLVHFHFEHQSLEPFCNSFCRANLLFLKNYLRIESPLNLCLASKPQNGGWGSCDLTSDFSPQNKIQVASLQCSQSFSLHQSSFVTKKWWKIDEKSQAMQSDWIPLKTAANICFQSTKQQKLEMFVWDVSKLASKTTKTRWIWINLGVQKPHQTHDSSLKHSGRCSSLSRVTVANIIDITKQMDERLRSS